MFGLNRLPDLKIGTPNLLASTTFYHQILGFSYSADCSVNDQTARMQKGGMLIELDASQPITSGSFQNAVSFPLRVRWREFHDVERQAQAAGIPCPAVTVTSSPFFKRRQLTIHDPSGVTILLHASMFRVPSLVIAAWLLALLRKPPIAFTLKVGAISLALGLTVIVGVNAWPRIAKVPAAHAASLPAAAHSADSSYEAPRVTIRQLGQWTARNYESPELGFTVYVLHDTSTWQYGAVNKIEAPQGYKVLAPLLQGLAKQVTPTELVLVGTASEQGDPQVEASRAKTRARNLRDAAQLVWGHLRIPRHTLNLGRHRAVLGASASAALTAEQRPVVILDIRHKAVRDLGRELKYRLSHRQDGSVPLPFGPEDYLSFDFDGKSYSAPGHSGKPSL